VRERAVDLHEGPHAARHYQFVARGIAEALQAVGAGATYRQAALVARERARRLRPDPDTGEPRSTRHGQLVMDWVEVFAPGVFEPHRPSGWPASGSLLLDDLPFSVRDPASGRFRIAFRVFCAVGFEQGRPELWRVEAFPEATQANREAFLHALEGAPPRVVCGNHYGLNGAAPWTYCRPGLSRSHQVSGPATSTGPSVNLSSSSWSRLSATMASSVEVAESAGEALDAPGRGRPRGRRRGSSELSPHPRRKAGTLPAPCG
jgi:hypothetical protein